VVQNESNFFLLPSKILFEFQKKKNGGQDDFFFFLLEKMVK